MGIMSDANSHSEGIHKEMLGGLIIFYKFFR